VAGGYGELHRRNFFLSQRGLVTHWILLVDRPLAEPLRNIRQRIRRELNEEFRDTEPHLNFNFRVGGHELHPRFWDSNFALHLVSIGDVLQHHALSIEERPIQRDRIAHDLRVAIRSAVKHGNDFAF
jgi:hypothetical protein